MTKRLIYTFLFICLCGVILIGCESYTNLIFKENIDYIKIQVGERYKEISKLEDINNLISVIEKSNLKEIKQKQSAKYYKIDVSIYSKEDEDSKKMTVIKDVIFYNNTCYKSNDNLGVQIENIYLDMNYPELIDKDEEQKIKTKKENRRSLSLQEALEGYWIDQRGNALQFKDGRLYQEENEFTCFIKSTDNDKNHMHISVSGAKGLLIGGKKLFDMYITFDDNRNNLKLEKVMVGGYTYTYNMIYIDEQNYKIGTFK